VKWYMSELLEKFFDWFSRNVKSYGDNHPSADNDLKVKDTIKSHHKFRKKFQKMENTTEKEKKARFKLDEYGNRREH
jgi:hypothetical protein